MTYNNLVKEGSCIIVPKKGSETAETEETYFLALVTEILKKRDYNKQNNTSNENSTRRGSSNQIPLRSWYFENPNNELTNKSYRTLMKWCKNDYHKDGLMWYVLDDEI